MKLFQNSSIRRKQMLIIMLTTSVTLLIACGTIVIYSVVNFRSELVDDTKITADVIGRNSTAAIDFGDKKTAAEMLSGLHAKPNVASACVYNQEGEILAEYRREPAAKVNAFPAPQPASYKFEAGQLKLFRAVTLDGTPVGTIFIDSDLRVLSERLQHFAVIIGTVFAASMLLAFVLSNWLQKLITGPILGLATVAREVALNKNYEVRVTKDANDEIGELIDGFNDMLEQIQQRDANLERRVEERTRELKNENAVRRQAENELRESQALYHSLVDQLPAGVFRKNATGHFVFVNPWFCQAKGLKAEEILGKAPRELNEVHRVYDERLRALGVVHHHHIMETGKPIELEEEYPDANGEMQYFHVVKSAVFGHDGKVTGSQGILFDITHRKLIEAKLAHERDLLGALMVNSGDCIYFKDDESRFIRCSTNMAKTFRLQNLSDLIGRRDSDFFAAEHADAAYAEEQRIIRTGEPLMGKIERETWVDGRVTWALTSKMPFRDKGGQIVGTFGISKDITPIKTAEEKLAQIHRQLVDASRQAGMAEIATSVLHNVGNVLNSVNVSCSVIEDKIRNSKVINFTKVMALMRDHEANLGAYLSNDPKGKRLPEYLASLAAHLEEEQKNMLSEIASLVNNIIHIKEIVATQQNYAKSCGVIEPLNARDLVEDAISMNTGAMARHQVKLVREFFDVPPILTEKHKVLQILVNLIRNAKYACDDSGKSDKQITLRVANGDGRILISVIDNGIGIPADNLTRIFNHGFTTRKDGHGFGLHSGALAAKELGGALTVISEGTGRGAAFTLDLPVNQPKLI